MKTRNRSPGAAENVGSLKPLGWPGQVVCPGAKRKRPFTKGIKTALNGYENPSP